MFSVSSTLNKQPQVEGPTKFLSVKTLHWPLESVGYANLVSRTNDRSCRLKKEYLGMFRGALSNGIR